MIYCPITLKIAQLNCQNKRHLTDKLEEEMKDYDIILLQEPGWAKKYPKVHQSWKAIYDKAGEGRAITLVNKNKYRNLKVLKVPELTDGNMVTIRINDITITNIYNRMAEELKPLQKWMEKISAIDDGTRRIIAGDFNLHHQMWEVGGRPGKEAREWVNWATDNGITLASEPYKSTHEKGGVIDLIFAHDTANIIHDGNNEIYDSDHYLLRWKVIIADVQSSIGAVPVGFNFKATDWEKFEKSICEKSSQVSKNMNWKNNTKLEINENITTLIDIIVQSLKGSTSLLQPHHRSKRWWTKELRQAEKQRKLLARRARRNPTPENLRAVQKAAGIVKIGIIKAKTQTWEEFLKNRTPSNIFETGPYIKPKYTDTLLSGIVKEDGSTTMSFEETMETLHSTLFPPAPPSTMRSIPVVEDERWPKLRTREIEEVINDQAPNKAPGPDLVKTIAIRNAWKSNQFKALLTETFRGCVKLGYHPREFRKGTVVVLLKPGRNERLAKSYRPITLLNTLGKILEKIIERRLSALTDTLIPAEQFGGRKGYSATDAVVKLSHDIETNKENGLTTSILAIDIKGAFDNVHRDTLLDTMKNMNLPSASRNWVYHFLTKRYSAITVDGKVSKMKKNSTGIPQGSPISPLLFLIYTSTLYEVIKKEDPSAEVLGFIDDITIYVKGKAPNANRQRLQNILLSCHNWASSRHTAFDYGDKLGFLHVFPKKNKTNLYNLTLPDGKKKSPNKFLKLLGIYFDDKHKFKKHYEETIKKFWRVVGRIGRLGGSSTGTSGQTMRQLYLACARPVVEYGSMIWFPKLTKKRQKEIQKCQNSAIRKILGAFVSTPIDALHKDSDILPIGYRQDEIAKMYALRINRTIDPRNPIYRIKPGQYKENTLAQIFVAIQSLPELKRDSFWERRLPWKKERKKKKEKAWATLKKLRQFIKQTAKEKWNEEYEQSVKGSFYRSVTGNSLYNQFKPNPMIFVMKSFERKTLSQVVQFRTGHGKFGEYLQRIKATEQNYNCECGSIDTPRHILIECPLYLVERSSLTNISTDLDLKVLLDSKKGLSAVIKFLSSIRNPHLQ